MKLKDIQKAVCINLDRRPERWKRFSELIEKCNLPFDVERVSAIDGNDDILPEEWGNGRGAGAWGCFRSHWSIIELAYKSRLENILIFEDDAFPVNPESVRSFLEESLEELPEDWEQFYLGCEHLFIDQHQPTRFSDHLIVPYNANRTHAYMLSSSGMEKVLELFSRWKQWERGWHIDWAMGCDLHASRNINVFCANPNIFGQDEGVSDVNPKPYHLKQRIWNAGIITDNRCGSLRIKSSEVGYGKMAVGTPDGLDGLDGIFAHAPSEVVVEATEPTEVFAYHKGDEGSWAPAQAFVDGKLIGTVQKRNESTETITIEKGVHVLKFETDDNRAAHTFWMCRPLSRLQYKAGDTFEVLSNARCPRNCPHCNQQTMMQTIKDYQYTYDDAEALVSALKVPVRLVFSGGEPARWEHFLKVCEYLKASGMVEYITATTSCDSKGWLERAMDTIDHLYLSYRDDMDWFIDYPPERINPKFVSIWNCKEHCEWPTEEAEGNTRCCCRNVGIKAAIFGKEVYPCILAKEMKFRNHPVMNPISVEDYFSGKKSFAPIGHYRACRWCVNNSEYRKNAKRVPTTVKRG